MGTGFWGGWDSTQGWLGPGFGGLRSQRWWELGYEVLGPQGKWALGSGGGLGPQGGWELGFGGLGLHTRMVGPQGWWELGFGVLRTQGGWEPGFGVLRAQG